MTQIDMAARRELWFQTTREHIHEFVNEDGSGKIPQFNPPWREPVWILPALYTGSQKFIDLANRMVERYNATTAEYRVDEKRALSGKDFNIFQSNSFAKNLNHFGSLLTPKARDVMQWHAEQVFKTHFGAQQSDYKFHGANDNMPMMATMGHILGGEALNNPAAIAHGKWMLHQFRRLLSRSAWASEYNSITYTPVTLSCVAKIATLTRDPETRQLARDIERRLWTEIVLHFHPGTKHQAGPHSRAYAVDSAGHTHSLHLLLWLAFGPEISGRDPIQTYFHHDGREVMHFCGCPGQNIAEYCDFMDTEFVIPAELGELMTRRHYPAIHQGRTEAMSSLEAAGEVHTTTYMEESFSLGSVDLPNYGGDPTTSFYATYKHKTHVASFKDAGTLFPKYLSGDKPYGEKETSADGAHQGEKYAPHLGWFYTLQKNNVALLLSTPHLGRLSNKPTDSLKLSLIFTAQYHNIVRNIMGKGTLNAGATGRSQEVACVSIETGEVYMHVQPLLPTLLPRHDAIRFSSSGGYELLDLFNYEGPERVFTRAELARILNGCVLTIRHKQDEKSLEDFHQRLSRVSITDYISANHRYFLFQRDDVEFEVVLSLDPFGVQTRAIDGRTLERPVYFSNQLDVTKLPFMSDGVARNQPHFPWGDSMPQTPWPNAWLIGSRGLPGEVPYSHISEGRAS